MATIAIDEGPPTFTSHTGGTSTLIGTNMAGAMNLIVRADPDHPTNAGQEVAAPYYINDGNGTQRVNRTNLVSVNLQQTPNLESLWMLNPITYDQLHAVEIAYDLMNSQAHVGMFLHHCVPTGSFGVVNSWGSSTAKTATTLWQDVDDDVTDSVARGGTDYIVTTVLANSNQFTFDMPTVTAANRGREVIVRLWGYIAPGDALGNSIKVSLYNDTLLLAAAKHVDIYSDLGRYYMEAKFENLEISTTNLNSDFAVRIESFYDSTTGTTPEWRIYALDALLWISIDDSSTPPTDETGLWNGLKEFHATRSDAWQNAAWDTHFSSQSYALSGAAYGLTYRDAVLDVLRSAPEVMMYLDDHGEYAARILQAYADESSPVLIGVGHGNLLRIRRTNIYEERTARRLEISYANNVAHNGAGKDQSNPDLNMLTQSMTTEVAGGDEYAATIERPWLQAHDDMKTVADYEFDIWSNPVDALVISCTLELLSVEPGDVVAFDMPDIGYNARKFCVVGTDFDVDNEEVILTLYDIEFTL